MSKKRRYKGRPKGSRNKGYFFRKGRGWYSKRGTEFIPLADEVGVRLRDPQTPESDLKKAYARFLLVNKPATQTASVTLHEVCAAYLNWVSRNGAPQTLDRRADSLFDLCYGLPGKFREREGRKTPKPTAADKIHEGLGSMPVAALKPLHIEAWFAAHSWNPGGCRTRLQAVKRALNRAVESGLIERNPIRGMKAPAARGRATYLSDEQEAALMKAAGFHLRLALRILIRTGMRPGCEFAAMKSQHVTDRGDTLEIRYKAPETKTRKKDRVIRVRDAFVVETIRKLIKEHPQAELFRNSKGKPWNVKTLSRNFQRVLAKAKKTGAKFDEDVCLYSCRHTYAKRILSGYWNDGKHTNIEFLAKLMGNTPDVCRANYLKWTDDFEESLFAVC